MTQYSSVTVSRDTFNHSKPLRPHPVWSDHKNSRWRSRWKQSGKKCGVFQHRIKEEGKGFGVKRQEERGAPQLSEGTQLALLKRQVKENHLSLLHPSRVTTLCAAQAGPAPSKASGAATAPCRITETQSNDLNNWSPLRSCYFHPFLICSWDLGGFFVPETLELFQYGKATEQLLVFSLRHLKSPYETAGLWCARYLLPTIWLPTARGWLMAMNYPLI